MKKALITGITGQDGVIRSDRQSLLLAKVRERYRSLPNNPHLKKLQ